MPAHRMWVVPAGLFAALALVAPAGAQAPEDVERRTVTIEDADYYGFDLDSVREVTLDDCRQVCLATDDCRAFTYNAAAQWCFLKSDYGELRAFPGAVAGRLVETVRGANPLPGPDLSFVPDWVADEVQRRAGQMGDAATTDGPGALELAARGRALLATDEPRQAAEALRQALALSPDDASLWRDLARAVLGLSPQDYSERWQLQEEATAAAYTAVTAATTAQARAEAYGLLARALTARDLHRPALEAYKAALALVDDPEMRAAYQALHAEHGFRLTGHTVESDAPSPRICVQFSEPLQTGRVDFAPFVRIDGSPPEGLSAEDYQLCIEGVAHGGRYNVTVRAGLPAAVGETIEETAQLEVYVRDRAPSARFTGRNFVLPRIGSRGVPVVSVNTDALQMELYRIGERGLAPVIGQGRFLSQLADYEAQMIAEESGEKVWQGTLEVRRELNAEVATVFPVEEALPERTPGVYVLRARPAGSPEETWQPQATQWFIVSDIGLSTLMGEAGLHVQVRSLDTAEALPGAEVQLIARNNEVLGVATTGADGRAAFPAGLVRGRGSQAPGLVTASLDDVDFAFLDMTGSGFDLTDRGVDGRPAPGAVDLFLYTERGVYRPGETVHLTALARDDSARALSDLPLTFVITRPDGMEDRRVASRDGGGGAHAIDLPLVAAAMRGTWQIAAHADPDAPSLARIEFLVEDFVPDRIEFDLTADADRLPRQAPVSLEVDGRFLYGAPAAELRLEGEIRITAASERADVPGYRFGLAEEEMSSLREPLTGLPTTDGAGRASFDVTAPALPTVTRPLEATVMVRMRETGGRAVERTLELPVEASGPMIGIRPLFSGETVDQGATVRFDAIAVAPDGSRIDLAGARWELLRVERDFQWYRTDGRWEFEPVSYTTRVADGRIDLDADRPARIEAPVGWGAYRLEIASEAVDGPATSVAFSAGWQGTADADSPDGLEITLDRPSYRVGDTARATLAPRHAGTAVITVIGEDVLESREVVVEEDGATIELEVGADWAPGAYVTATLFQPGEGGESHLPARAVGLSWLAVDTAERTLSVELEPPSVVRPRASLLVPAAVAGLPPGERAHLTVAAVDVGILNLTNHEPPAPEDWYFGQRRLAMEMRDLYGSLIDGLRGETGRLRSGGGAPGEGLVGSPPTEAIVALYSGIVAADERGRATVAFDLPEFSGTVRVMAVAWSESAVGHASADVIVRDPVVVTASLPRFLAPGDESRLHLDIDNAQGPAGTYDIEIETGEHVAAGTPQPAASLELASGERRAVSIPLTGEAIGEGTVQVRLVHTGGLEVSRTLNLAVRAPEPVLTERRIVSLAPGQGLTLDGALAADRLPSSGEITLSATRAGRLDVPALVAALDRFPYGCAEQITSRALPLLYLSEVAGEMGLGDAVEIEARIAGAIRDVLAKQSGAGSFGLWGPGGGDLWLDAYVSDFLTRAGESGHEVPREALALALDNLSNTLAYTTDAGSEGSRIAYALYVLARNQRAAISDLRYYADTALDDFPTPLAKAQLGAALSLYGETDRAGRAFAAALSDLEAGDEPNGFRADYGSELRDGAAVLMLVAETGESTAPLPALLDVVEHARAERDHTSTQENAWLLLAAHALMTGESGIVIEEDGTELTGNVTRRYAAEALDRAPVAIRNAGERSIDAVLTVTGVPATPHTTEPHGFEIGRAYYTLEGEPVPVDQIAQNQRLVVVVSGREHNAWSSQVLVTDKLPAGFEIDNPSLVASADLAGFDWLDDRAPAHVEFRDDRFVAAFERTENDPRDFTLAYVVRAVTPGVYVHPPVMVEDMYRPYLSARGGAGRIEVLGPRP